MTRKPCFFALLSFLALSARPGAFAQGLSASRAAFISGATDSEAFANSRGVFPVSLEWSAPEECDSYVILRAPMGREEWSECGEVEARSDGGAMRFIDANTGALPNQAFRYKVEGERGGKTVWLSEESAGWGALTALAYMDAYNESIIASHGKFTLMNKRRNLAKLGRETCFGDLAGDAKYRARVRGFSGLVTIDYTDYMEFSEWALNGSTNIKANIKANGKMFSHIDCRGMYPGTVYYDNIKIKKGKAGGGYYTVSREGFPDAQIPWDAIQSEIRHLYHESEESPDDYEKMNAIAYDD